MTDGFEPPWWHGAGDAPAKLVDHDTPRLTTARPGQDDPQALELVTAQTRNGLLAPYVVHGTWCARGLTQLYDWMAAHATSVEMGKTPTWAARVLAEAARDLDAWRAIRAAIELGADTVGIARMAQEMERVRTEGVEPSPIPV